MTNAATAEPDHPQVPRALGYLRKHLLMTETEMGSASDRLAVFARVHGFSLEKIYVEELESWPAAFEALVEASVADKPSAVLLPSMLHFAVLGLPGDIKKHFEHLTGARVLAVSEVLAQAGTT